METQMTDSTQTTAADTCGTTFRLPDAGPAFISGTVVRPEDVSADRQSTDTGGPVPEAILIIMTLIFVFSARRLMSVLPLIAGSILRWKENVNLESDVKATANRNLFAMTLFPVWCVLLWRYGVWTPPFVDSPGPGAAISLTAACIILLLLIRAALARILKPASMNVKIWKCGNDALFTYFTATALTSVTAAGTMAACGCSDNAIRMTIIYLGAAFWLIFLIRKMQIFKNSCSLFAAILYLCTLETLPMAAFVATAMFT